MQDTSSYCLRETGPCTGLFNDVTFSDKLLCGDKKDAQDCACFLPVESASTFNDIPLPAVWSGRPDFSRHDDCHLRQ